MRLDAADQDVVPVDDQMMRCDRPGDVFFRRDIVDPVLGGHMFHGYAQGRNAPAQRVQNAVEILDA